MNEKYNIIGITGHRKIYHKYNNIKKVFIDDVINKYSPDIVITGMALGFDMLVAEACLEKKIPYLAAIPFTGQNKFWSEKEKTKYKNLVMKSWKHKIVSSGGYQAWKLFERNKWIVNNSKKIICYWNEEPKGGTSHCVKYAKKNNIEVENIFNNCA